MIFNPKTFVRKHLFDEEEQQALFDQFKATTDLSTVTNIAVTGQRNGNGNGVADPATLMRDGEEPPFDFEAT